MISDTTCNFQVRSVLNRLSTVNYVWACCLTHSIVRTYRLDWLNLWLVNIYVELIKLHCGNYKEPHRFMLIHHFIYHIYHIWDILPFFKHHHFVRSSTTFMRRWLCVGNLIFFQKKWHIGGCAGWLSRKQKLKGWLLILLCRDHYWSYNPTALQLILLEFVSNG